MSAQRCAEGSHHGDAALVHQRLGGRGFRGDDPLGGVAGRLSSGPCGPFGRRFRRNAESFSCRRCASPQCGLAHRASPRVSGDLPFAALGAVSSHSVRRNGRTPLKRVPGATTGSDPTQARRDLAKASSTPPRLPPPHGVGCAHCALLRLGMPSLRKHVRPKKKNTCRRLAALRARADGGGCRARAWRPAWLRA